MECKRGMSFEECELAILRNAVDKMDKKRGQSKINNPDIIKIIGIVEKFLVESKRMLYGGTAINNLLPMEDQFYDKSTELPDYDFWSPDPVKDAKKLADIYYKNGFQDVEAKAGIHAGTFKVFVNFIPVADITFLPKELYDKVHEHSKQVVGMYYSPPNFLRMLMYLELSRPEGDVSRWEKVLKRLTLLNKHYPLRIRNCAVDDIQRLFQYGTKKKLRSKGVKKTLHGDEDEDEYLKIVEEDIFNIVKDVFIANGCVFFGAFANRMYLKNLKHLRKKKIPRVPDFDVLSEDPETTARIVQERLTDMGVEDVSYDLKEGVGEIIAPHYEITIGDESVAFIFEPMACHSYNIIKFGGRNVRIATLDTMLSLYLAFLYVDREYFNPNRILCMSQYLFKVQQKNRLKQKGLLKRFSLDCYGHQETLERIRQEKSEAYKELRTKRNSKEFEWWFLRYIPRDHDKALKKPSKSKKKTKSKKKGKSKSKSKTRKRGVFSALFN